MRTELRSWAIIGVAGVVWLAVMITGAALIIVAALIGGVMDEQSDKLVSSLRGGDDESQAK